MRPNSDIPHRARIMSAWYRAYLKDTIPLLIVQWETLMGVHVAEWGIIQMKTKWGTCNIEKARILVNLELAKKSDRCLEYIIFDTSILNNISFPNKLH